MFKEFIISMISTEFHIRRGCLWKSGTYEVRASVFEARVRQPYLFGLEQAGIDLAIALLGMRVPLEIRPVYSAREFTWVVLTGGGSRASLFADTGFGRLRHPDLQTGRTRGPLSRCAASRFHTHLTLPLFPSDTFQQASNAP